jgi:uncharacterized protein (TIGR00251 family)
MSHERSWYRWDGADLIIAVRIQPKAAKDEVVGLHGDALKIRITAPPVDGKANAHLQVFLAEFFGVAKSHVELISGQTGRDKRWRIVKPKILDKRWF